MNIPPVTTTPKSVLHLEPGETFYCGYHEWAVHPDEAAVILDRGYVVINGETFGACQVAWLGPYPQIQVWELKKYGDPSDPRCPALQALDHLRLREVA